MNKIKMGDRQIGRSEPAYIIAEIGSNFDGSKERAKKLIDLAKECGADAVKFQSFTAETIVSKEGFANLKKGFQSKWKKPVYEVYKDAEFPPEWVSELYDYAGEQGLHFLSSPYEKTAVDLLDELGVPAFKIGSGDITWHEMIRYIARKGKPIIMATGASTLAEVEEAIEVIMSTGNEKIILLQCVTNYPSKIESANIRAMKAMGDKFDLLVGYSDHTPGNIVALGAVSLGACIIEKHFTDDKTRDGPDHPFAMDGEDFKEMSRKIRQLESALGESKKRLYEEEIETVTLQRRCLRASQDIPAGTRIAEEMISVLRPLADDYLPPKEKEDIIGKTLKTDVKKGDAFTNNMF